MYHPLAAQVNAELAESANEQRIVFVVDGRTGGRRGSADLTERGKRGLDPLHHSHPLAGGRDDRRLEAGRCLFDPARDVREQRVHALDLQRGQLGSTRRLLSDHVQVHQQRLDLAIDLLGDLLDALRQAGAEDNDTHLDDGHHADGQRDDPEEDAAPLVHAVSPPWRDLL